MRGAISQNVCNFWNSLEQMGFSRTWLVEKLAEWKSDENQFDEILGMSRATGISLNDLRVFQRLPKDVLSRRVHYDGWNGRCNSFWEPDLPEEQ